VLEPVGAGGGEGGTRHPQSNDGFWGEKVGGGGWWLSREDNGVEGGMNPEIMLYETIKFMRLNTLTDKD
jgi:hypothetical protein